GRIAVRWSPPIEGTPKTVTISREADGWDACFSCAEGPVAPLEPTGQETGIDLGLESFATLADGTIITGGWHHHSHPPLLPPTRHRGGGGVRRAGPGAAAPQKNGEPPAAARRR